jgi:hypothetical protein
MRMRYTDAYFCSSLCVVGQVSFAKRKHQVAHSDPYLYLHHIVPSSYGPGT